MTAPGPSPETVLILASASTSRAAMLRAAGLEFYVEASRIDEAAIRQSMLAAGASPRELADKLAELKALQISGRSPGCLVLGADQVLVHDSQIFGKPVSRDEARCHLQTLRGSSHQLLSAAVVVFDGQPIWRHIGAARMTMRPFTDRFLESYLDRIGDLVLTSVGCYHLEGPGSQLFARVEGDYFTILGLPLLELLGFLRAREVLIE